MKEYFLHRNVAYLLIAWWSTDIVLCGLGIMGDMSEVGIGLILAFVSTPFVFKVFKDFRKKPENEGKKLFLTKVGYITAGICLGFLVMAISFNLMYEPGWFDFTDFLFYIFSIPLSLLIRFNADNEILYLRMALYGLTILNLILISYFVDLIGWVIFKFRSVAVGAKN